MTRLLQEEDFVLNDKSYKIRKFTPQTACYWAFKLFGSMMSAKEFSMNALLAEAQNFAMSMDQKNFALFQKDCLSSVLAISPHNNFAVIDGNGNLTVPDMTAPEAMQLTIKSFIYSISDFFDLSLLGAILPQSEPEQPQQPASVNTNE